MTFLTRAWSTLSECESPADYYRLQLDIQQFATPQEVVELVNSNASRPPDFELWLRKLIIMMVSAHSDAQEYAAHSVGGRSATLYRATKNRARRVVVGFCGKAGLLFLPVPVILQYFGHAGCDFLVLRDDSKLSFFAGLEGHSTTFQEMIERVRTDAELSQYEDVRTFGTSGGGVPALAGGVVLNAPRAVCFSGHMPMTAERYASRQGAAAMDALLRDAAPLKHYTCVFGNNNAADTARAYEIAQALGARLMPIPGVASHNVILPLVREGSFLPFLREVSLI